MLINTLGKSTIDEYCINLKSVGMLSGLSSQSDSPYINPRVAENIFA